MKVTQIAIGRFHHFHLARQLEKRHLLDKIYTGYPKFKLKDEQGVPVDKIKTFPWVHAPYMKKGALGLGRFQDLNYAWKLLDVKSMDLYVRSQLKHPTNLVSLSGSGLYTGMKNKKLGGNWICDRGSSHIRYQDNLLREEYKFWCIPFQGNDVRIIAREEEEYERADFITVPSQFTYDSFIEQGVPAAKMKKIPYGANLTRFTKTRNPENKIFSVLWVGNASIRKGFLYALDAFQKLRIKNKKFTVIGSVEPYVKDRLKNYNLDAVNFLGTVPNSRLKDYYSSHHVFVLPSIEEGLAMVQTEALACGCPVIATYNTGSEDLFTNGEEGFIVPLRNSKAILECFERLLNEPELRNIMSEKAIEKVHSLGGWDTYGDNFTKFINSL